MKTRRDTPKQSTTFWPLTLKAASSHQRPIGPASYDTAIDYNPTYQDGSLHIRRSWARR